MLKRDKLNKKLSVGHTDFTWDSEDGVKLYAQTWVPDNTPRGIINIIHGLGEHSGRYAPWAGKLAHSGYVVRSFDYRGHGRSTGKRGHSKSYQHLLSDIGHFIEQGRTEYPDLPVFLYGQSLGGNLVLNYSIQHIHPAEGLIVTSPWLELTNKPSAILLSLVTFLSYLFPAMQVHNRVGLEDLSRDLRVVHSYKNDPLVHDRISLQLFRESYRAGLTASLSIYKINSPLLVMHGTDDRVTSCKATRKFVQNAGSKTQYSEWEGGYHELHNDLDKDNVFENLVNWLDQYAQPVNKQNA